MLRMRRAVQPCMAASPPRRAHMASCALKRCSLSSIACVPLSICTLAPNAPLTYATISCFSLRTERVRTVLTGPEARWGGHALFHLLLEVNQLLLEVLLEV